MVIRLANENDFNIIITYDKHIRNKELLSIIMLKRVLIAEDSDGFIGWLRWNMFSDNTPFMTMLYVLEPYRNKGYGTALVINWEEILIKEKYNMIMTPTLANENAQHFYRKLGYVDSGSLLLSNEPLEIIFVKKF